MGFIEIERTAKVIRKSGVDAIYRLNGKGVGTLRFTRAGSEKVNKIKGLDASKPFKLYIDKDTKNLAFEQTEEGKFKLGGGKGTYTLSYSDLSREIKEMVSYILQESKEYTFVLIATGEGQKVEVVESEVVESEPEPVKAEEPESKAKKSKAKKK
jgi:hypothetical protein